MTLEELIEVHYNELNENDLYIWQYIYHHKSLCQKMSIQELSHHCNVSPTSIVRLTRKLGLEGYSELKLILKWSLEHHQHYDPRILRQSSIELKETIDDYESRDLDSLMEQIDKAKRIFVYASGETQYNAALEFKKDFTNARKIVHVIEGVAEIDPILHNSSQDDLYLLISLSGDNEIVVTLARALQRMKIPAIGIALNRQNLLSKYVPYYLGFNSTPCDIGLTTKTYTSTIHLFVILNRMFYKYIEYLHYKEKI